MAESSQCSQSVATVKPIENVQIIHAEADEKSRESVIRPLAQGLEKHLKLPGQADCDYHDSFKPENILSQLKAVIQSDICSVLYISDVFLKLFKDKRSLSKQLRELLEKNRRGNGTRPVAILWGEIGDVKLVKKVLDVKYKDLNGSFARGLDIGFFSPNEIPNVVETVKKEWQGQHAILPSKSESQEPADEAAKCNSSSNLQKELDRVSDVLPSPGLSIVYSGKDLVKLVHELAPLLMEHLFLEASPHYFNFNCVADEDSWFEKVLMQVKGLYRRRFRLVFILTKDLLELLHRKDFLNDFADRCSHMASETPVNDPQIVFLMRGINLSDVEKFSKSLADTIKSWTYQTSDYSAPQHVAYELSRFLHGGSGPEAVEQDEPTACRSVHGESINKSGHQVLSSGESITTDNSALRGGGSRPEATQQARSVGYEEVKGEPVNKSGHVVLSNGQSITLNSPYPNGGSLPRMITGHSLANSPVPNSDISSMGDLEGDSRMDGANPPTAAEVSIVAKSRSADSSADRRNDSNFSVFYGEQQEKVDASGKTYSHEEETVTTARRNSDSSCLKATSLSTAQGCLDKPHSLKSKTSSVTFRDSDSFNKSSSKQSLGISKHASSDGVNKSADSLQSKFPPLTVSTSDRGCISKGSTQHYEAHHQYHRPQVNQQAGQHLPSSTKEACETSTQAEKLVAVLQSNPDLQSAVVSMLNLPAASNAGLPGPVQDRPQVGGQQVHPASTHVNGYVMPNVTQPYVPQHQQQYQHSPGVGFFPHQPLVSQGQSVHYQQQHQQLQQQQLQQIHPSSTVQTGQMAGQSFILQTQQPQSQFQAVHPSSALQTGHTGMVPSPGQYIHPSMGFPGQPRTEYSNMPSQRQPLTSSKSLPDMGIPSPTSTLVTKLSPKVKNTLGMKLNSNRVCSFNWKHFAEEIGVTFDQISVWENLKDCNYMDKVFEWIGTNREDYTVAEFRELAVKFERPDVVKVLNGIA